jgi:GNAT superfamily N-acetyltransferase
MMVGQTMSSEIVIRLATQDDLVALGRLGSMLVRIHHGFDAARFMAPPRDAADGYGWFLGSQLDKADALVLVAEHDGKVIGYVYGSLEGMSWKELRGPAGFIHDVVVDEASQGQGIGTALLQAAAGWLEEHGAPRVMLWTAEANPSARRLFERLGFRSTMVEMTREPTPKTPQN